MKTVIGAISMLALSVIPTYGQMRRMDTQGDVYELKDKENRYMVSYGFVSMAVGTCAFIDHDKEDKPNEWDAELYPEGWVEQHFHSRAAAEAWAVQKCHEKANGATFPEPGGH